MTEETNKIEGTGRKLPHPNVPRAVAQTFLLDECADGEDLTLRHWRGDFMTWTGTHWRKDPQSEVRARVKAFTDGAFYHGADDKPVPWVINKRITDNIMDELVSLILLPAATEPGTWLGESGFGPCIAFENCLLDLAMHEEFRRDPRYFNLNSLPFGYDPSARCPEWEKFVASVWPDDLKTRHTLAQMLGYLVSGRTDLQCMFGLIGPPRAGKGVVSQIATELVGRTNTTALHLSSFGERFGLSNLIGKSLAIMADVRTAGKNKAEAVERLLSITGRDAVQVDRKKIELWDGRLDARVLYLSNETPYLGDASGAVAGRFVMLPFSRSFAGAEDRELEAKLAAELPGILNWAFEGLAELDRQGGRFTQSAVALELKQDTADLSSPMKEFLRDTCDPAPGGRVEKTVLYRAYRQWAVDTGRTPVDVSVFARNLLAEGQVGKMRGGSDGERRQMFTGIRLRNTSANAAARVAELGLKLVEGGRDARRKTRDVTNSDDET